LLGAWWLTPVILATEEAEIRRIEVQSLSGLDPIWKILHTHTHTQVGLVEWLLVKALSSSPSTAKRERKKFEKLNWKPGVVAHTSNPTTRSLRQEVCEFETHLGYMERPCLKQTKKQNKTTTETIQQHWS
jgi:hypothetical protein